GRILVKKSIVKNSYQGYDITNRTRRGDVQRYNIFITPFEVIIFKISGNGNYVVLGSEAERFFGSIQLKEPKTEWKKWSPVYGGFTVEMPHQPLVFAGNNRTYAAYDAGSRTAFEIIRTDIHNYDFLEEDSFDLELMEESFAGSAGIDTCLSRQWTTLGGYMALDARYRYKNGTIAVARFLIKGPHYYTLIAASKTDNRRMQQFIQSFAVRPFQYREAKRLTDTVTGFTVMSPVALEKETRLAMYPDDMGQEYGNNADDSLVNNGSYKSRLVENDSTGEKIYVTFYRKSPYYQSVEKEKGQDSTAFKKAWLVRSRKTDTLAGGMLVTEYVLGNAKSSRILKGKSFFNRGFGYTLETELDSISKESAFIDAFYESFQPLDTVANLDIKAKKSSLFFTQFFSKDTVEHKRAVKNISVVRMDSTDFGQLKRAIESLGWKERSYLLVKKELLRKIALMPTRESAAYLKEIYYRAGDTAVLQYAALETLLSQQTTDAYQAFAGIMQNDPPVLDMEDGEKSFVTTYRNNPWPKTTGNKTIKFNGSFFDNLTDSLQLTAGIIESMLPLLTVNDYQRPVMELLGTLVDSSLIQPSSYKSYLPKFILEARQMLKKQQIREKAKAIEKAEEEEKKTYTPYDPDNNTYGNIQLSLYATLILPFWNQNPQVQPIMQQLLISADNRLRYNTAMLLLRNGRPVEGTILAPFAALDEFRQELYTDLKNMKREYL
ncbi:MAG TPA: hypothetical protein VEX65_07030, partial [Flavisolibacter sp.]|nr:hypothetical protein [Flavisolibacter sp.]